MDAQPGASADLGAVASAASPPEAPTVPLLAYRTWAWRFFAILDAVVILGGLLALTAQGQDPIAVAMLLILAGAGIAVLTVLLVGIDRSAAWAIHTIAPACSIIIVFGLLRAVVALTTNSINIPLEVIGAGLVLSRPHPAAAMPRLSGRDPRSVTLMVGAMAVMQLAPYLAAYTAASGRAVDPGALRWWEIMGNLRWAATCHVQAQRHLSGADPSVELASLGRRAAEMELEFLTLIETTEE